MFSSPPTPFDNKRKLPILSYFYIQHKDIESNTENKYAFLSLKLFEK
jgi:hypothetical protein